MTWKKWGAGGSRRWELGFFFRLWRCSSAALYRMLENVIEIRRMAFSEREESVPANKVVRNVQPLRDLFAAEMASSCVPRKEMANGLAVHAGPLWGPTAGNLENLASDTNREDAKSVKNESQELRFLFAKDWSMQNSDDEDDFWASGSLCGAVMTPRRRTRPLKSDKKPPSSSNHSPRQSTKMESSRINSPSSLKTSYLASRSGVMQQPSELSPGCLFSRLTEELRVGCGGAKPSLGTLLAAEVAIGRDQRSADRREGNIGFEGFSFERDAAVRSGESSRRVKIGSLCDVSAPVHPESHTRLKYLIAEFLTSGTNPVVEDGVSEMHEIQRPVRHELDTIVNTSAREDGLCCTSERSQSGTNLDEEVETLLSPTFSLDESTDADVNSSTQSTANVPNFLPNPPTPGVFLEVQHSSRVEPLLTIVNALNAVSDAGLIEESVFNNVDDLAQSNADGEEAEAPRVQLETLLEQARGEHGWLPLGRSRMGSPSLVESPSLSCSSSRISVLGMSSGPPDDNCQVSLRGVASRPSHAVVDDPSNREVLREELLPSSDIVERPEIQQSSDPAAGTETPLVDAAREAEILTPATEQPPRRVSLLSLLNQDMENVENELEAEKGVDEQDDHVTEQLDPLCCVCMVGHKGAAFIPCGHTFCRRCCREVRRSKGSCPLCNKAIIDVLNIY